MLARGLAGGRDGEGAAVPVGDRQEGCAPDARRPLPRVSRLDGGNGRQGARPADQPAANARGLRAPGAEDTHEVSHF